MFGLRIKVVLTLLAVVLPISLLFSLHRYGEERRAISERRADRVATHLMAEPERICEADPQAWSRRGLELFLYDHQFQSPRPGAPPFPDALREGLRQTPDQAVHVRYWRDADFIGATAAPLEGSPECAFLLLRWSGRDRPEAPLIITRVATQTLTLLLTLILVGLLISAPLVYRLRRLMEAVKGAKGERFDNPEQSTSDEIAMLAGAFGATLESLHTRDAALKEYIANTTHDLAIPLTVLQHKLTALRTRLGTDDPVVAEHLETAIEESHYIASLIANMSAAARLEAEPFQTATTDVHLDEIVARTASRHKPIAEQRGVELNWAVPEHPAIVTGDPTLVEQAASNLVQNAVQYNGPGGHVSIILEHTPNGFELSVIDDGPGIPPEMMHDVIKRGVRSDEARSRNGGGQGFGLAIAHQVCERHGWKLDLVPREDGGTVARITAPAGQSTHRS